MKITYFLNWMGPPSLNWYKINNCADDESWAGGRIDIYGNPEQPFGEEYMVPIMDSSSWIKLAEWLNHYETDYLPTFEEIINTFESETGHKIRWWKKG